MSQAVAAPLPRTNTPPPVRALTPAPPALTPAAVGYFERRWPAAVILVSFAAVTVPMAAVVLFAPDSPLTWLYLWLFGMTHFVLTFTVYLTRGNLRHFASNGRNIAVFFAVPVALFVGFDLLHAFRVGALFPLFALVFWGAVRLFDFLHLKRQTFGVYQLFKGRTRVKFSAGLRRVENAYCVTFALLLMTTFLAGGVCPLMRPDGPLTLGVVDLSEREAVFSVAVLQWVWTGLATITAVLFTAALVGAWRVAGGRPGFAAAAAYLFLQAVGAGMAAVYLPLYLATLAIHYVEYHVLMVPRWASVPLEPTSRLDRTFGWLRARPVVFYAAVVGVAFLVIAGSAAGMGMMGRSPAALTQPIGYLAMIAVFDGIFVFHYFVEMFIWRFGDPHFRRTVAHLYFAPKSVP